MTNAITRRELTDRDTHRITGLPQNRLVLDSRGRGWNDVYASVSSERSWESRLPAREHDCLVYCLRGEARVARQFDGEPADHATLRPRQFSVIPAGRASHWSVQGRPEVLLVYLHRSLKERSNTHSPSPQLASRLAAFDPLLEQVCLGLLGHLREPRLGHAEHARALAQAAMAQLVFHHAHARAQCASPRSGLERVLDTLHAQSGAHLSVSELARLAGMSETRLCEAFKAQTGQTPYQYALQLRLDSARNRLLNTQDSISDIAAETGFASQSHFAASFRRIVGLTPTAYRRAGDPWATSTPAPPATPPRRPTSE